MSLFQPCEMTKRSVTPFGRGGRLTSSRTAASCSGLNTSPSFVNSTGRYWNDPTVAGDGMRLHRLNGAHDVDQARTLEVALAAKIGRRLQKDALHFLGLTDEFATDGQKCGNGTRHVRRGHARSAVLDVQRIAIRGSASAGQRRAGAA